MLLGKSAVMQTHILSRGNWSYCNRRPRQVRSTCLQSRRWATEWFWQCWVFATYSPCRGGEEWHLEFLWICMKVTLVTWTAAHSDWDFLHKLIILTCHFWFSSQNTQRNLSTCPTSWIQAAVRAHSREEDMEVRCGHPVHKPGCEMDVPNPSPQLALHWNWVWRSGLERLSRLLLVGNRQ